MNNDLRIGAIYRVEMTAITVVGVVAKVHRNAASFTGWEITIAKDDGGFLGLRESYRNVNADDQRPVFMRDIVEVPAYAGGPMTEHVDHALDTGDAFAAQEEPRG